MGSALKFLTRYAEEGEEFLDSIVTGDETWVYHHTPESKQQSLQWRHTHSPKIKKFKTSISTKKLMASVFWDRKGILLVDFRPPGTTINAAAYCEILRRLRRAIQNKRRGMLTRGVCLLHDNARPHTARDTTALLERFKWDVLEHPPYSPDLAPSDFHLFLHLKKHLGGKRFDDDKVKEVMMWFNEQAADFYDSGIQKLVPRLNKCLDNGGDYVEK
ncbi:transposase [Lasius niger]|uniref:Transposase n=1 Tax=Lasius niger TaxID=67767 RepID=A0A0J7K7Y7_LASNI|nr:transposase [Lasius niger]